MMYYQIDDKLYYINLDVVFSIISENQTTDKLVNTTITQYYGGDAENNANNGKEIVESKSNFNETLNNVRYDFVKFLISCLLTSGYESDGSTQHIIHHTDLTFAQGLCLNTLIKYKILSEIETNNE